jgi:hypothetical protein
VNERAPIPIPSGPVDIGDGLTARIIEETWGGGTRWCYAVTGPAGAVDLTVSPIFTDLSGCERVDGFRGGLMAWGTATHRPAAACGNENPAGSCGRIHLTCVLFNGDDCCYEIGALPASGRLLDAWADSGWDEAVIWRYLTGWYREDLSG